MKNNQTGMLTEDFPVPYISWSELADHLQSRARVELGRSTAREGTSDLSLQFGHIERFGGRLNPFIEYLAGLVQKAHTGSLSRGSVRGWKNYGTNDRRPGMVDR